jgi:hypothetical protein
MTSQFDMLIQSKNIGAELEGLVGLAKMRPSDKHEHGGLPERLGIIALRLRQLAEQAEAALVKNEQAYWVPSK